MGRPAKSDLPSELRDILHHLGANLIAAREERGMSQIDLANEAGISITTLNEIESRRHRDVRLSTLCAFSKVLKVSVIRLLHGSDLELDHRDQVQLLKASEAIFRISKKISKR